MVDFLTVLMSGAIFGLLLGGVAQNRLDDKIVGRGWFEHRGQVYTITPAKVAAP